MQSVTESPAPRTVSLATRVPRTAPPARATRVRSSTRSTRSIGSQLERDRLEQRAVRVRQVIHALRERADARDTAGGAPRPLRAAIEDFGRELAELERRLRHHVPAAGGSGPGR
ncbi:MAG TPA: hypothetical protein VFU94_03235 [Conexibacter sp.]|nr:hypothetical protein [Conexibacter sp.]